MNKLLLGLGTSVAVAFPIGFVTSCSMDEIIGTVAIIKENKGFVVIASKLSNRLTDSQVHNALKALKYIYNKQKLTSDLISLEIGASDSKDTMAFIIPYSSMSKVNIFLKSNAKDIPIKVLDLLLSLKGKIMPKDPNVIK